MSLISAAEMLELAVERYAKELADQDGTGPGVVVDFIVVAAYNNGVSTTYPVMLSNDSCPMHVAVGLLEMGRGWLEHEED